MPTPNNDAANGYWVHDAFGPRHYVAPPTGEAKPGGAFDMISSVLDALSGQGSADLSRVHAAFDEACVVLSGTVRSGADRDRAVDIVRMATGGRPVTSRIVVDEVSSEQTAPETDVAGST